MSSSVYPISFSKRIATSARAIRSSVQDTQGTCGTIRYSVPQSEEATDGSNISHQQLWIPCFRSWSVATNTLVAKTPPPPPPLCMGAKAKAPHGSLPDRCLRTRLNNIEYFPPNFEGLVLGCIDADFASKYSLENSRRDLHNALLCTVFGIHNRNLGTVL